MISMIGLVGGLLLLTTLALRGWNLFIAAPLCALIVGLSGGIPVFPGDSPNAFVTTYMNGFAGFVGAWFLMFLLGSLFGKFMEDTGTADSLARWIISKIGMKHAVAAIVLACAVLTYGGVSVYVVAFSVYPMALGLFKDANLPRRFIPGALAFGSITFTMTTAGSPEIQNWIPVKFLHTSPYAAWEVSFIVAIFMAVCGFIWITRMIRKAIANGEHFEHRDSDPDIPEREYPNPIFGLLPLLVVLSVSFFFHESLQQYALILALLGGCICIVAINFKHFHNMNRAINEGTTGALIAIGNTAAVVGFGTMAKASPAFAVAVDAMTGIPGNELIGAAVAVTTIAGLTGSASGGLSIALPVLAPHYTDLGVNPDQLHRISSIASGALDSLPHNGYIVTTVRAICGETHKSAYWPIAALTIAIPTAGLVLAVTLMQFF
ncbi:GntP family permease [Zhongshania sp. BJYM1]|uniref:GntP family permease n=1 Tax=Zhongshania aquatica TaxID=2965069 RepID=UPI0022B33122|nr:GntP family permease [Marortus sp. BJYM1]